MPPSIFECGVAAEMKDISIPSQPKALLECVLKGFCETEAMYDIELHHFREELNKIDSCEVFCIKC